MSDFSAELATAISQFHWLRPWWLLALLPGIALAFLLARRSGNKSNWQGVIAPELLPYLLEQGSSTKRQRLHWWLLAPWLCACLALAGPSWHKIPLPIHKQQSPLVILLDLSPSMLAEDVKPNRLTRARLKLIDLLKARQEGTTALIAYAGDAHVVTPLTDDSATIMSLLPALNPTMMPLTGNQPLQALQKSTTLIGKSGYQNGHILLVSDGLPSADLTPMNTLLENLGGFKVSVLAVGTKDGAPIPSVSVANAAANKGGFVKDSQGNIVIAQLREVPLRSLAQTNGGIYRKIALDDSDSDALNRLFDSASTEQSEQLQRTFDTWHDSGFWLVLPLLPFLLLAFRRNVLALVIVAPLLFAPDPVHALEWQDLKWQDLWLRGDQQGQKALAAGDAKAAESLFNNPSWKGSAAYKNGDFTAAEEHFKNGDASADNLYNLANAQAKAGELQKALDNYQAALKRQSEHSDAAFNKDLVEKALEQQEQEEQQKQKQKQEDGEKGEDSKDNKQDGESPPGEQSDEQQDGEQDDQDQQAKPESEKAQDSEAESEQDPKNADDKNSEDQSSSAEAKSEPEPEEEKDQGEEAKETQASAKDAMPDEQRQALEQWLRRVPDDPSGLMRRKFQYEAWQHQQRAQSHGRSNQSAPQQETERW